MTDAPRTRRSWWRSLSVLAAVTAFVTGAGVAWAFWTVSAIPTISTTIAPGSNGATLPQATIHVASTTGFAGGTETIFVVSTSGTETVTCTGITGSTFTTCSGGTGTLATGNSVTQGDAQSKAVTLATPGSGSVGTATSSSLVINWGASSGLPVGGGYVVLRSTSSGGTYSAISGGTCQQSTTRGSSAVTCTDNDPSLAANTTYYYEVEAAYYNASGPTLWVSSATAFFYGTTLGIAPSFTSPASISFTAGTAGSFNVTTSGTPAVNSITNTNFGTCTKTTSLPTGVAFNYTSGASTATITSTTASPAGTTTFCLNAVNGVSPNATQQFTLTINPAVYYATPAVLTQGATAQSITITGAGFVSGASLAVSFTGAAGVTTSSPSVTNPATMTVNVTVPSGQTAGNTYGITVTSGLGGSGSCTNCFAVNKSGSSTPSVVLTFPVNGGSYNRNGNGTGSWQKADACTGSNTNNMCGTASTSSGSVSSVSVAIVQENSDQCWGGTSFNATCDSWNAATGTTNWTLSWSESNFSAGTYLIVVRVVDSNGNTVYALATVTIT